VIGRRCAGALLRAAALALLASCKGDTVHLGDDPKADGGEDRPDAGWEFEPCIESSDCESDERPYCNLGSYRCVECLRDWQCESGRCRNEEWGGECVPAPVQ
jgi:hypothetical protein